MLIFLWPFPWSLYRTKNLTHAINSHGTNSIAIDCCFLIFRVEGAVDLLTWRSPSRIYWVGSDKLRLRWHSSRKLRTIWWLDYRLDSQAVQGRVLHHNSELTNFVWLTEEIVELSYTLGQLEEEVWRFRQWSSEHQVYIVDSCGRLKPRCSKIEDRIIIKALWELGKCHDAKKD